MRKLFRSCDNAGGGGGGDGGEQKCEKGLIWIKKNFCWFIPTFSNTYTHTHILLEGKKWKYEMDPERESVCEREKLNLIWYSLEWFN